MPVLFWLGVSFIWLAGCGVLYVVGSAGDEPMPTAYGSRRGEGLYKTLARGGVYVLLLGWMVGIGWFLINFQVH